MRRERTSSAPRRMVRALVALMVCALVVTSCSWTGRPEEGASPAAAPTSDGSPAPTPITATSTASPSQVPAHPRIAVPTVRLAKRATPVTPAVPRPNILFLLTDDAAVTDLTAMPRTVRWMRRHGTEFTQAVSQYPLCCPARVSLLSGQEPHNHGVLGNEPPWGGFALFRDKETVPVWLHRRGYRTSMLGKYLQGLEATPRYVPPGWDDWRVPTKQVYNYYGRRVSFNGRQRWVRRRYHTRWVGDVVGRDLTARARDRRPFFEWVSFLAPHVGGPVERDDPRAGDPGNHIDTPAVQRRYRDTESGTLNPRDEVLDEPDNRDKATFMQRRRHLEVPYLDEALQQRRESLRSVDDVVMTMLDQLRRTRLLDRTVVVLTSDNGFSTGSHRWFGKIVGYEESARVPLLVAGPGFARGVRRDQLVTLTDLAATFVDLGGARARRPLDGRSIRPISTGATAAGRDALLLEAGGWPFEQLTHLYRGVRTADGFTYLRWYDGHEEVYDLRRDRIQAHGEIDGRERARLPFLRRALRRLQDCRGQGCYVAQRPTR